MVFWGICLSLIVIFLVIFSVVRNDFNIFISLLPLCLLASVMVSFFVSSFVTADANVVKFEENSVPIYSLNDNLEDNSLFVLGTGSSSSNLKYHYFVKDGDYLEYSSVSAKSVKIQFDDVPRLVTYSYKFKNPLLSKFFFCLEPSYKVLYVPESTIYKNINIDLK